QQVHTEKQRSGCQRFFTTRQLVDSQRSLSFRFRNDFDFRIEWLAWVNESKIAFVAFRKEGTEDTNKVLLDLVERIHKGFACDTFYLCNCIVKRFLRFQKVFLLRVDEVVAFLDLRVRL